MLSATSPLAQTAAIPYPGADQQQKDHCQNDKAATIQFAKGLAGAGQMPWSYHWRDHGCGGDHSAFRQYSSNREGVHAGDVGCGGQLSRACDWHGCRQRTRWRRRGSDGRQGGGGRHNRWQLGGRGGWLR